MKITFNPDLFNNIYWHIKEAFENVLIRFIWAYGGSSASKTYSVVQALIIKMMEREGENAMVLRKYATDIKDSIYADFRTIIEEWNLDEYFILQQNFIICKLTGSYARFRGLDESGKIKGLSGFKRIILDEVDQFDEADLKQIRKRLRGRVGQQIICLFNPVSEEHWIKVNIFDHLKLIPVDFGKYPIAEKHINDKGNTLILKTNYLDNKYIVGPHFVDQHVIDDFESDKIADFNYYQIYALGNWGKLRTGGEFWKDFNSNKHIAKNPIISGYPLLYDKGRIIHMGWDKNVHPYQPCSLWQTDLSGEIKRIWQFDEIALADPINRVKNVCAEFIKRYPPGSVSGLYVYGDRTAIADDSTKEKGENMYTEIMGYLKDYNPTLRMQSVNPSVSQSGKFINEVYARNFGDISITIGDNCRKSISDYQYALEDSEGNISKKTKINPVTKVSYQEFGHFSDIKRYVITVAFPEEYASYLRMGRARKIRMGKHEVSSY